ncbi:hypothetical protein TTHERM_00688420 (macronuclear) [Tetrahymena thermophila SB210]|uniref:Uncharacterized protein n=1 Tax=Tetrahymena thermophila (strain SB210) TaxID=312017 RepID=I7MAY0_TETTS|nr:hypothetical protein TTHERM_00688420 [Tetrahymena thermophila SB210]EAS06702.2 hypothetical protein TTHERM_00688420 [Tetrahymena thermophila SB210]|eukprot:XP_001026944.2 hypothetical protein TTHERM_00688420 [Tetrahymena thermophila SB210]
MLIAFLMKRYYTFRLKMYCSKNKNQVDFVAQSKSLQVLNIRITLNQLQCFHPQVHLFPNYIQKYFLNLLFPIGKTMKKDRQTTKYQAKDQRYKLSIRINL